jgi:hypothetical protein
MTTTTEQTEQLCDPPPVACWLNDADFLLRAVHTLLARGDPHDCPDGFLHTRLNNIGALVTLIREQLASHEEAA